MKSWKEVLDNPSWGYPNPLVEPIAKSPVQSALRRLWTELPSTGEWQYWDNNFTDAVLKAAITKNEAIKSLWWVRIFITTDITYGPHLFKDLDMAKKYVVKYFVENEGGYK